MLLQPALSVPVRDLGICINSDASVKTHISRTVSGCFTVYCRQIRSICWQRNVESTQLDRHQSMMNAAARLLCSARKSDHITPLLRDLHWLRVMQRIELKLAVEVFRCHHGLTRELRRVADMDSRRRLRSASALLELNIPSLTRRVTVGDRAFGVVVACVWNGLPPDVISSPSLPSSRLS